MVKEEISPAVAEQGSNGNGNNSIAQTETDKQVELDNDDIDDYEDLLEEDDNITIRLKQEMSDYEKALNEAAKTDLDAYEGTLKLIEKELSDYKNYTFNGLIMGHVPDFANPLQGTYWIWDKNYWKKCDNFVSLIQKKVYNLCLQIKSRLNIEIDYIKLSKRLITYLILPNKLLTYQQFKSDSDVVNVFTKNSVISIGLTDPNPRLFNNFSIVSIKDGIGLTDPNPRFFNFWRIEAEPENVETPVFDEFLSEVTGDDQYLKDLIIEMIGYCLTPSHIKPAVFFLVGPGRNGKSTLLNLIRHIVGHQNTSSLPLEMINDVTIERLAYTLVNIPSENAPSTFNSDLLKVLSGGEYRECNPKYKPPYTIKITAKMIFALNNLPRTSDTTKGFWDRVHIIPLTKSFEKEDPYYLSKLLKEINGITYKALTSLIKLYRNAGVFTKSAKSEYYKNLYKAEASSVFTFVYDIIDNFHVYIDKHNFKAEIDSTKETDRSYILTFTLENFYKLYSKFCDANNHKPLSKREMKAKIIESNDKSVKITRRSACYMFIVEVPFCIHHDNHSSCPFFEDYRCIRSKKTCLKS